GQRIACLDDGRSIILATAGHEDTHPSQWRWTDGPGYASVARPRCDAGVLPACDAAWASIRDAFSGSGPTGDTADITRSGASTPPANGCGGRVVMGLVALPLLGVRRRRGQRHASRRRRAAAPTC
ncbi:MAG: hypothetical protein VX000_02900, partial [Myxococcota bacterium]|nr:hypothetical protein [Myxococcota bacterium]